MSFFSNKNHIIIASLAFIVCGVIIYFIIPLLNSTVYTSPVSTLANNTKQPESGVNTPAQDQSFTPKLETLIPAPVTHVSTPLHVKAAYLSSWTAGAPKYLNPLLKLAGTTELNTLVIDVKDSTGRIGFPVFDPNLAKEGSVEKRIPDVRALTNLLHQKNIYIIGRVAVFQDPYMTKARPEWAIKKKSDGTVWKDHKGLSFLDPANKEVWDYIVAIAHEAYADGFDEINFDYIRYPSDGDIKNINYHLAKGHTRSDNMEVFFKYLNEQVKKDTNIPISADVFGLTTEGTDDMGIGQVWEKIIPHFDFISPMVYPSHYPPGHAGYVNPAKYPYEVIDRALQAAVKRTEADKQDINKIRPWLQDFNLGAVYTKEMVQAEMKAVYDNKLSSWMLWDPKNKYTPSALELESTQ